MTQPHPPQVLSLSSTGPSKGSTFLLAIVMWFFPALGVIIIVGGLAGLVFLPVGAIAAPVAAFFMAYSVRRILASRARLRCDVILGYFENAVRLNLPLDRFLAAAEASERGVTRMKLRIFRQLLSAGAPLGIALERALPELSPQITSEITVSHALGCLQPTLSRTLTRKIQPDDASENDPAYGTSDLQPAYRFYPLVVGASLLIVGSGMMIFIVPKFREIFKDFRVNLPPITQFFLTVASWIDDMWPLALLAIFVFGVFFIASLGLQLHRIFLPNWPFPRFARITDTLAWHTPVWRSIVQDRNIARVCRVLADSVRFGNTFPDALTHAQQLSLNFFFSKRITAWRENILRGQSIADAARSARLPPMLVSFLPDAPGSNAPAGEARALGDALEFLSRYYDSRFSPLATLLRAASEPAAVIGMGIIVGLFVYSMFSPLKVLIDSVLGAYPMGPV